MDHRLYAILQYSGLIILKNGLKNILKFTANDYRNIMKVIVFIVDNLYENYHDGGVSCDRLCDIFHIYLKMYMMLHRESFTEMDLAKLQVYKIFKCHSVSQISIIFLFFIRLI